MAARDHSLWDWAFYTSAWGGILILASALLTMLGPLWSPVRGMLPVPEELTVLQLTAATTFLGLWGLALGLFILVGAARERSRPDVGARGWGIALMVAAVLSVPSLGGFLLGGVLAFMGGILYLTKGRQLTREGLPSAGRPLA